LIAVDRAALDRFRDQISRRFGLRWDDDKLDLLGEVLDRRARARGLDAPRYLDEVTAAPRRAAELRALADELTIGETYFLRNADSFRALAEEVLPALARARAGERRLRIVSAGCASGEEPYSIAITARESAALAGWDLSIVGLDLNPTALALAREARYTPWSLRATPPELGRRWFRADGGRLALDPTIVGMVSFEEANLVDEDAALWAEARYDVVFCRNVLMYLEPSAVEAIVARIGRALVPGGYLFLGHAETLRGVTSAFHLCHTHDTFYYRRRSAAAERAQGDGAPPATLDGTWFDHIQRAATRIEALAGGARPSTAPAVRPPAARADLGQVVEAMRQERFADGLALLGPLSAEREAAPDELLVRAVLLVNAGRLDEAQAACVRLIAADELNAGAHYVMALCHEQRGDRAAAIEHGKTAAYLDAGFAMPRLHLGLMARRAGDAGTAQRELGAALALFAREDAGRLLLFGGGFSRESLIALCRAELRGIGG
jgi:chemotaxis protein methyltransferase CheR